MTETVDDGDRTSNSTATATWGSGLAGCLVSVVGINAFDTGSVWQILTVLFGAVLLAGSSAWAIRERKFQAAFLWGLVASIAAVGAIASLPV